ncbi:DNA-binding transcriptional response regulator, NtrC family, contains REC, AAA-type ATPase, and a Fis-type DNA-binding domains [Chitinophaga sp. YR573]|uniref:sigma-54-dependent transcriptional regulator n=1 Tax=Chitinophaga sp. YR573 TaxID=1881040 RepID=UPI0008B27183|nr:sigma-54 dependent transcriptional regulator [Chitinophaga sp. YR573]SEW05258.1 DNA-binding transcriptional response regulator, NtrC family, contains REC, AAA-type ATPase, and a Fis-type DNA-binding domains [Chitinophaga sp. YR573]
MNEQILIVEDELIVASDLRLTLERAGYRICGIARSVIRAQEILKTVRPDIVLLDIYLKGDLTGIDLAAELNQRKIPFVYLSENCNNQVLDAAKLTQPYGFLIKPFREKDLLVTLDIARYRHDHQQELRSNTIVVTSVPHFQGIIGNSQVMQHIFHMVRQVAPMDTSVLVLGETGTGKEGIANAIHQLSARKNKAFVKVNCAALPAQLIESELFGHEKGAFTGAVDKRIGKFEQADGGTIFLDEIGEMPVDLQVKLLRVLQEREIERIGGKGPVKVNVRIIAATSRNLEKEIANGNFRLDLYYRLHVFPIQMPPLRERKEDIPLLVSHFIQMYAARTNKTIVDISPDIMHDITAYHWPGNVRELQHLIERSILLAKDGVIRKVDLPSAMVLVSENAPPGQIKTITELERDHILSVLKMCNNKIAGPGGAAELLNLPPTTLASKMKKLGITRKHSV